MLWRTGMAVGLAQSGEVVSSYSFVCVSEIVFARQTKAKTSGGPSDVLRYSRNRLPGNRTGVAIGYNPFAGMMGLSARLGLGGLPNRLVGAGRHSHCCRACL